MYYDVWDVATAVLELPSFEADAVSPELARAVKIGQLKITVGKHPTAIDQSCFDDLETLSGPGPHKYDSEYFYQNVQMRRIAVMNRVDSKLALYTKLLDQIFCVRTPVDELDAELKQKEFDTCKYELRKFWHDFHSKMSVRNEMAKEYAKQHSWEKFQDGFQNYLLQLQHRTCPTPLLSQVDLNTPSEPS